MQSYTASELFAMRGALDSEIKTMKSVIRGTEKKVTDLKVEHKVTEDTWKSLRVVLEKFSDANIHLLEQMFNTGVRAIFDDKNYSIKIEINDNKRKGVKLWLVEEEDGEEKRSRIPTGMGGGIQVALSFILNVYLIRIYNLRPFMVMDESFTQISTQYLPNFIRFLQYLIDELDFTFLWVTHDERVVPYFDTLYRVNRGNIQKVQNSGG